MTLHYVRAGEGEPLLLIHGIGHSHRAWIPVTDALVADRFDVVAIDAPGFGASAPLPAGIRPTVAALADAITDFVEHELGWERPHVGGNSMGGALALELAARGEARSATALSPAGFWNRRELRFCQLSLTSSYTLVRHAGAALAPLAGTGVGRAALAGQLMHTPWKMPAEEARATLDGLGGSDAFPATLAAFDALVPPPADALEGVPVTIAWAQHDHLLIPRQANRARRLYPRARHVTLRGVGHVPTWDNPALVARTLAVGARSPAGAAA